MTARRPITRTCPMCAARTRATYHCGIDLTVRRKRWSMSKDRIRLVHCLATRKGLDRDTYKLRLQQVGCESSKTMTRSQFTAYVRGLQRLPDCPAWLERQRLKGRVAA